ncbi:hypothetical protein V8C44DRAFT_125050 [Trichoderma aethiopicum]
MSALFSLVLLCVTLCHSFSPFSSSFPLPCPSTVIVVPAPPAMIRSTHTITTQPVCETCDTHTPNLHIDVLR